MPEYVHYANQYALGDILNVQIVQKFGIKLVTPIYLMSAMSHLR